MPFALPTLRVAANASHGCSIWHGYPSAFPTDGAAVHCLHGCPIWHECPSALPTLRGCRRLHGYPIWHGCPSDLPTLKGCRRTRRPQGLLRAAGRHVGGQAKKTARKRVSAVAADPYPIHDSATLGCNSGSRVSSPGAVPLRRKRDGFPTQMRTRHHGFTVQRPILLFSAGQLYTCRKPLLNSRFCAAFPVVPLLQ